MKNVKTIGVFATAILTLAVSSQSVLAAEGYSDINHHWNKSNIMKWQSKSIVSGYADGTFKPDNAITRGEFSVILSRVFKIPSSSASVETFSDVPNGAWYANAVNQMRQAGILSGYEDGTFGPNKYITRQEAAAALAKAFEISGADTKILSDFTDGSTVDQWAAASVAALIQEGYLNGSNKQINAKTNITRGELVMLIEKTAGNVWEETQNASTINGNLVVNSPSALLQNISITGDLFLAQGIDAGNVTLDNVQIAGRLVVLGGGENSIHLRKSSVGKTMIVNDRQNRVRIVIEDTSHIGSVLLRSGGTIQNEGSADAVGALTVEGRGTKALVQLKGIFGDVSLQADSPNLSLDEGKIQTLLVDSNAQQSNVSLQNGTSVEKFQAKASAQITGKGIIKLADIQANGVQSAITPDKLTLGENITMRMGEKEVSGKNNKATTSTSSGGSGGSGNNGGSGNSGGSSNNGGSKPDPVAPTYIKNWAVSAVGTVKYVSVAFTAGTKADYTFEIDGTTVTNAFTHVTTEGNVVKYELQKNQKVLTITKKADNTKVVLNLS